MNVGRIVRAYSEHTFVPCPWPQHFSETNRRTLTFTHRNMVQMETPAQKSKLVSILALGFRVGHSHNLQI